MTRSVRSLALALEALLLPTACLACERPGAIFCAQCEFALTPLASPRCRRCAQTEDPWEKRLDGSSNLQTCGFCQTWPDSLAWADSAAWFGDEARALVHALKYGGWRVAATPM